VLGPRALLARLDQALDLRGSDADRPTRHRTLRDTIEWSYRLLPPEHQGLFRRLGVFAGGADLKALAAVCTDGAVSGDPMDLVADLVDASLVTVTEDDDGEPRFTMLETVRAFALDALAHAGELEDARQVHASHCVRIAGELDARLVLTTREQVMRGVRRFGLEQKNFREALVWATTPPGRPETVTRPRRALGLALLSRIGWIWTHRDLSEHRHWLEAILEMTDPSETADLGRSLSGYAQVLMLQGDDGARAREPARRSVAILRALGDPELPEALAVLGELEAALGDTRAGRRALDEAVRCARQSGDNAVLGDALRAMAGLDMDEENWEGALEVLQEALELYPGGGDHYNAGHVESNTAFVLRKLGRVQEAHALMSAHLWQWMRHESPLNLAYDAEDYSAVLAEAGFATFAPLLLGAADAERERRGVSRDQLQETQVSDARAAALLAMTSTEWDTLRERGRRTPLTDALLEAISSTTDLLV
jgi:tetratricopeptide (TPR) repeat protein